MENKSAEYSQSKIVSFTFKDIYFDFRKILRYIFPSKLIKYLKIHPAHWNQSTHDYHFNIILAAFEKELNLLTPGIILILFTSSSCCLLLFYDLESTNSIHTYSPGTPTPFANCFEKFKIKSEVFGLELASFYNLQQNSMSLILAKQKLEDWIGLQNYLCGNRCRC